jgi:hypothetical protein
MRLNIVLICGITLLLKGELMPEQLSREWRVPEDFPTIQAAIEAAQEGDTILIAPGVYREHLVIPKSVTLQGSSPAETILEGESSEFEPFWEEEPRLSEQGPFFVSSIQGITPYQRKVAPPAIVIQAQKVQIRSLQIRPQGWKVERPWDRLPFIMPRPLRAGIVIERGAEALVDQVIIRHAHYGIFVRRGASLTLHQSVLHNWHIGIEIWGRAVVEDSSLHNEDIYESESSEKAIILNGEGRATLRRNRFSIFHVSYDIPPPHRYGDFNDGAVTADGELALEDNQIVGDWDFGVHVGGNAVIRNNLVIYRGHYDAGIEVYGEAIVEGNTVLAMMPHGVGIQINPRAQATVRHNKISQNSIGIEVVGATAQLVENEVYANKNGIQLTHHWQGDGQVELVRNKVSQNEECGISAHRYVEGKKVYEIFAGQLTGEGNEVQGNLQADLCPADYPWPPGFRK